MRAPPCLCAPQRCQSVPQFSSLLPGEAAGALALRDDCSPSICSPRPAGVHTPRLSQAEMLAALSAQLGSSSLCSPRTSARDSPDSVAAPG